MEKTEADAQDALKMLKSILDEKRAQLRAVETLYNTGIAEHADVVKFTRAIGRFF